ncbi:MAG: DUF4351 domain-containing protein [Cyanobacteria bacterium J06633_2]
MRQLTRQFGVLPADMRSPIDRLPINALEQLAEALLDFSELSDLQQWLLNHPHPQ